MAGRVRASHVVSTDDTITHMLCTVKSANARMWVYVGDVGHPYNIFDFTLNSGRYPLPRAIELEPLFRRRLHRPRQLRRRARGVAEDDWPIGLFFGDPDVRSEKRRGARNAIRYASRGNPPE